MAKSRLPKSIRKFLRKEKARIRREFSDEKEIEARIKELVSAITAEYNKSKGRIQQTNGQRPVSGGVR